MTTMIGLASLCTNPQTFDDALFEALDHPATQAYAAEIARAVSTLRIEVTR